MQLQINGNNNKTILVQYKYLDHIYRLESRQGNFLIETRYASSKANLLLTSIHCYRNPIGVLMDLIPLI